MRHAYVMAFSGGTLDQYNEVIEKMELGGELPPGGVFHWVTVTDDGLLVTDVWESDEQFQAFAAEKIGPLTAEAGLPAPEIQHHEVHNTIPTPAG